jgi:hypothetical protein
MGDPLLRHCTFCNLHSLTDCCLVGCLLDGTLVAICNFCCNSHDNSHSRSDLLSSVSTHRALITIVRTANSGQWTDIRPNHSSTDLSNTHRALTTAVRCAN